MVADSSALSSSVRGSEKDSARGASRPCITWWKNYASRFLESCSKLGSPLKANQPWNYNFRDECSKTRLHAGLLSDLHLREAFQQPNFDFGTLHDQDRSRAVSIGRQQMKMECAIIHVFSDSVPCLGKGAMHNASREIYRLMDGVLLQQR